RHASIRRDGAKWELSDQDSANGTLLRGARITGSVAVKDGDELQFGEVKAIFRATPSDQPSLPPPSLPSTNSTRARAAVAAPNQAPGAPGLRDLLARLKLFSDIGALSRRTQDLRATLDEALRALLATFPQTSRAAVYARHGGTETLTCLAQHATTTSGGSEFV